MPLDTIVILFIITLLSSIIGGMMGGAILILFPSMIFLGVPVYTAVATSKLAHFGIGIGSVSNYHRHKKISWKIASVFTATAAIGSIIGAIMLPSINESLLKTIIALFMILVCIFVLLKEKLGVEEKKVRKTKWTYAASALIGLILGVYGGLFGGGISTVFVFFILLLFGLGFTKAVATAKPVVMLVNIIALSIFISKGLVDFSIGIPLLIASIIGSVIGSEISVKVGNIWVRRVFIVIVLALALKLLLFQ